MRDRPDDALLHIWESYSVSAIVSSGDAGDLLPSEFIEARGLRRVPKPYDTKTLLVAVDAALAQA